MPSYDFKIAKTVLSDKDKDRLACLYLSLRPDGSASLTRSLPFIAQLNLTTTG
jgi:hypothetical protein